MRFLLFNFVVAGALFYLLTGGRVDLGEIMARYHPAPPMSAPVPLRESISEPSSSSISMPAPEPEREPEPRSVVAAPKPPSEQEPEDRVAVQPAAPPEVLPPLEAPQEVRRLPELKPNPAAAVAQAALPLDPTPEPSPQIEVLADVDDAVAARRAEVLAEPSGPAVKLKDGTSLMSRQERTRALDALIEDMELMYLENAFLPGTGG